MLQIVGVLDDIYYMTKIQKSVRQTRRTRGRPKLVEAADIDRSLLQFALEEFLEHGYGGASVSRIVRKAGISKTTLYSRYASKEDIFRAIVDRQIEKLAPAELLVENGERLDLAEGLKRYAYHMLDVSMEADLLGINRLMYSESHRFPELGEAVAKRTQLGVKRIAGFIQACAEQKVDGSLNPHTVAEVFILSIRGWYIDAMLSNRKVSRAERHQWVDQVVQVLFSAGSDL